MISLRGWEELKGQLNGFTIEKGEPQNLTEWENRLRQEFPQCIINGGRDILRHRSLIAVVLPLVRKAFVFGEYAELGTYSDVCREIKEWITSLD